MEIGSTLQNCASVLLPIKPAFPFLMAVRDAIKAVKEEWLRHGEPINIPAPTGQMKFDLLPNGQYYLATKYEGAQLVAEGIARVEKTRLTGAVQGAKMVTSAIKRARTGRIDLQNEDSGCEQRARLALKGVAEPIAQELAECGWFGIAWPPVAK